MILQTRSKCSATTSMTTELTRTPARSGSTSSRMLLLTMLSAPRCAPVLLRLNPFGQEECSTQLTTSKTGESASIEFKHCPKFTRLLHRTALSVWKVIFSFPSLSKISKTAPQFVAPFPTSTFPRTLWKVLQSSPAPTFLSTNMPRLTIQSARSYTR